jgi:diguanylate cyclase (GGDEF)-like protein
MDKIFGVLFPRHWGRAGMRVSMYGFRLRRCRVLAAAAVLQASTGGLARAALDGPAATGADPLPFGLIMAGLVALLAVLVGFGFAAVWSRRKVNKTLQEVERLKSLFDVLDEGIVVCSGMQVVAANTSLCRLIGVPMDAIPELMISHFVHDTDIIGQLLSKSAVDLETQIHTRAGEALAVEITARTILNADSPRRVLEIRDIRDRKATQERISFLAHHDALTTLPNREVLRARLAQAIQYTDETGKRCAVIWIDLDGFKGINDLHGHAFGDQVLRAVAERLRFELPAGTLIARLGGDEFVVLCDDISDASEARLIGQQLRRLLNRPIDVGERSANVGASIGLAVYPDDGANADELLKNADLALYQAKSEGRGKCRHFTEALGGERQRRMALSEQLRGAIEHGAIEAYFQPLVSTRDRRIVGFEALGRWFHPEFGAVPPFEFVRIAEENGLINPLTDLIMRRAIDAAGHWPSDVRVSVNVSPMQINSELIDSVRDLIKETGFDPRRLELEVTEDVLIKDFDQTASMFSRLRALGIQVAMDDFGAGFTSLGNLRRLNFDRIKIDRIFTTDLPNHRRAAAIVRAMFVLARELDLEVTVEGVETVEQLAFLSAEGSAELQGFLFSKPKPLSAFTDIANLHLGPAEPSPPQSSAPVVDLTDARRSKRAG